MLPLFADELDTGPTPVFLCMYDRVCAPRPLAEFGAPVDHGDCINVDVRCLKCRRTGVISSRKDLCAQRAHDVRSE